MSDKVLNLTNVAAIILEQKENERTIFVNGIVIKEYLVENTWLTSKYFLFDLLVDSNGKKFTVDSVKFGINKYVLRNIYDDQNILELDFDYVHENFKFTPISYDENNSKI